MAVLAEIIRAGILSVDRGQSEAAFALGLRKWQVMTFVLVPQAVRRMLPVLIAGRREQALVYLAMRQGAGVPRPGYIALVVAAARDWALPEPYIRSLMRWSPSAWQGARVRDTGEFG
jgi:hypothetical protein